MKYLLDGQETKRLKFRLLTDADFDTWISLFRDSDAGDFLGMADLSTPEEQCKRWFDICDNRYKNDIGGMNVLIDKTTEQMVGQCGILIQDVDEIKEFEVGYSILPKYQGMGYATEAATKCRDYGFEQNFYDHIISIIHIDNVKSAQVAMRNGMNKWKRTEYKKMPVDIFRITRDEWLKKKSQ